MRVRITKPVDGHPLQVDEVVELDDRLAIILIESGRALAVKGRKVDVAVVQAPERQITVESHA